jgi:AcrR family transcriptional regulator
MPRISAERRETNRESIVTAARHCFSRNGFHGTSMPDIATEAGLSTGAPYRYFASKEEIILEIAGEAFRVIFDPVIAIIDRETNPSIGEFVGAAVERVDESQSVDRPTDKARVEELFRCGVQSWGELLRNTRMRRRALEGFEDVRGRISSALRRGQDLGTVPIDIDPENGSRVVMALLHGFIVQRVAFGLTDVTGFAHDARSILIESGMLTESTPGH